MSKMAGADGTTRGWPEHFAATDAIGPDQFLAQAKLSDATRQSEPEANPWDLEAWTHAGPKAEAYFGDDAKIIAMRGPVGSGKTTANLRSRFRRAMMIPRSTVDGVRRYKVVIARATYRQLWQTTIPSWWEIMPKGVGKWAGGRGDPVTHTIEWTDAFGPVEFIAEFLAFGESPGEIQANMRGLQCTDLLLEEADTCHIAVLTVGSGRINRYPAPRHFTGYTNGEGDYGQISMTYNATDIDNWVVKTVERDGTDTSPEARRVLAELDKAGIKINFYRQPGYGEPGIENAAVLSPSYYPSQIATMRAAGKTDDIERLVYNRNSVIVEGDLVFKRDFNRAIHVAPSSLEPWPGVGLRLGFDQGFAGAMVVGQFRSRYHWQVLSTLMLPGRTFARDFGEAARDHLDTLYPGLPVERATGDMAGGAESSLAAENETWNSIVGDTMGIWIEPQMAGGNRVTPRLEAVRAALAFLERGAPGLVINPEECGDLVRAFLGRYVWTEAVNTSGDKVKTPDKRKIEANVMDALQYMLMQEMHVPGQTAATHPAPGTGGRGHNGGPPLADLPAAPVYGFDPLTEYRT